MGETEVKAEEIKNLETTDNPISTGKTQKLWKVGDHHVVTSATNVMGEPETYVFPSDEKGNVTDWLELPGSYKGGLDHGEAICGYVNSLLEDNDEG